MAWTDPRTFTIFDYPAAWPPSDGPFWWPGDTLFGRLDAQAKPGGGGGGGGGGAGTAGTKPSYAIAAVDAVKAEGDGGGETYFIFAITRAGDTGTTGKVDWSLSGSGANPADTGTDFAGQLGGTVEFGANQTIALVTVRVRADGQLETDEGFTLTLANAAKGGLITTASAEGLILNDDSASPGVSTLSIAATDANKAEGSGGGQTGFTFTVTREGDITGTSSVSWSLAGSGVNPADGADFAGALGGTVNFAAGETTQIVTVLVNADATQEASEGFTVTLSAPVDATIATASAQGSIVDDDGLLTSYLTNVAGSEYDIHILFIGTGWTTDLQGAVIDSANILSSIIVGDVSDVIFPVGLGFGDPAYELLWGTPIDDIVIEVRIGDIVDDPNDPISNVVAETRILAYRDAGDVGTNTNELNMPVAAEITLDNDDVAGSLAGDWNEVLLHEMIHSVGFSYGVFTLDGLLGTVGHGPFTTYQFLGAHAVAAYANDPDWLSSPSPGLAVPMTWDGSHWDEVNFHPLNSAAGGLGLTDAQELMTTTFAALGEDAWLSDVTVGVLADLGYAVADPSAGTGGVRVDTLFA